ncbi:hypothetical protein [Sphingobium yanoikuyae]|uniref:hypothetical protein n=2 Tax=Pseudomonadota TaxID=1224 RepID=UPI0022DCE6DB|nr:hypothetical protein [Sphingobium yanoikuyae]WBQ15043.1 hypothetical protein PAE53_14015 [Sphingobium yanoikuyae]
MKVITAAGAIEIGTTETAPTIGLTDYSRRVTDDFGVTTVVKRNFSRTISVRVLVPTMNVDALQRQLAALRATPALWVADDRFDSLSVMGFYKELSIDLAIPPISYCTLTIEGLAEEGGYADPGTDPAPDGQPSTFQLLQPVTIDDAAFVTSTVPEDDYPAWAAGPAYALGARVIRAHRIYESAADDNQGNDPQGVSGLWIDIGPTNRWAMFDQALGSLTEAEDVLAVSVEPAGTINGVALLDVTADTVRVIAGGYDRTVAPEAKPGMVAFLDMPTFAGEVTVILHGDGPVSVGTLMLGTLLGLGNTEAAPTAAIIDYSRKETDDFGEVTLVERAWAKRMTARSLIDTAAIDVVAGRIANVRATPALWIGNEALESVTIYGFFKDFSIEVGEHVSTLSLSVEGLSAAAKIAPLIPEPDIGWTDVKDDDPAHPKPQDGATVGAPEGTPVGAGTAKDVIDALLALGSVTNPAEIVAGAQALVGRARSLSLALFDVQLLGEERKARWENLTHFDGVAVTTRVRQEIDERVEGQTAIVTRVNEIEAAATDGLSAAMAAISDESEVRASADEAETHQRELAISLVHTAIDDVVIDVQAAIDEEAHTRADAVSAETDQRELAISQIRLDMDGAIADVTAAIEDEAQTRADDIAAETDQRELALSQFRTDLDNLATDTMAAIGDEARTRADEISAETDQREIALSQIRLDIEGVLTDAEALISDEAQTRADDDAAETLARELAISTFRTDVDEMIGVVTAAVQQETETRASETEALARDIEDVSTTVGEHTSSVTLLLESVDGLSSRLVARVVEGDLIGGFELAAGGGQIDANFLVDNFGVVNRSGDGWEFSNGRQVTTGGSIMSITGAPFGSTNQFLEWTGPIVSDLAQCTESNALKFIKTNGQGYYRGGIIAGDLRASMSNSSLGTSASTAIGPLVSNGNEIIVNASYSMMATMTSSYPATVEGRNDYDAAIASFGPVSGDGTTDFHTGTKPNNPPSGSFTMQIRKGTSVIMSVNECNGSIELLGSRPVIGDAPGQITWTYSYWASVTTPDPEQNTTNRNFSANFSRSFSPGSATVQSQFISVTSTEWS